MKISEFFGTELPIIQAPMAGAQSGAMAIAVSNAGALGSLPCALLTAEAMRKELELIKARTNKPYNVNFFCHAPPVPSAEREAAWRAALMSDAARHTALWSGQNATGCRETPAAQLTRGLVAGI